MILNAIRRWLELAACVVAVEVVHAVRIALEAIERRRRARWVGIFRWK